MRCGSYTSSLTAVVSTGKFEKWFMGIKYIFKQSVFASSLILKQKRKASQKGVIEEVPSIPVLPERIVFST